MHKRKVIKRKRLIITVQIIAFMFLTLLPSYATTPVPKEVVSACDSVVRIYADYDDEYALGTGFVISNDNNETLIVTNHHVAVADEPRSLLVLLNTDTDIQASVVVADENKDLAVIKVAFPLGITPVTFAEKQAEKGDAVYAIGFPSAADVFGSEIAVTKDDSTITDGIISAVRMAKMSDNGADTEILQITAAINAGNSGGPLVNEKGEVVGICTYGVDESQGIFGAISGTEIKSFLSSNKLAFQEAQNRPFSIWVCALIGLVAIVAIVLLRKRAKNKKLLDALRTLEAGAFPETQTNKTQNKPANKKLVAIVCIVAILFILSGTYVFSYKKAVSYAVDGDAENARKYLIAENVTKLHDSELSKYIDAVDFLAKGDFETAEMIFEELAGYLDADKKIAEIEQRKAREYKKAMDLFNEHEYESAYKLFCELGDYSDSYQMKEKIEDFESKYQEAQAYFDNEEYFIARTVFKELANVGYRDSAQMDYSAAREYFKQTALRDQSAEGIHEVTQLEEMDSNLAGLHDELMDFYYDFGVTKYRERNYDVAKRFFQELTGKLAGKTFGYKRTLDYLTLIEAHQAMDDNTYELFVKEQSTFFKNITFYGHFLESVGGILTTLRNMDDFEDSQLLYSKMCAWWERYCRENDISDAIQDKYFVKE